MAPRIIYSEKKIEHELVKRVNESGGLCLKLLSGQFNGLPDRMCLFKKGKIIFVEVKTTGQKPRKIQLHVHSKLKELGFEVLVVDTPEQIDIVIQKLNNDGESITYIPESLC